MRTGPSSHWASVLSIAGQVEWRRTQLGDSWACKTTSRPLLRHASPTTLSTRGASGRRSTAPGALPCSVGLSRRLHYPGVGVGPGLRPRARGADELEPAKSRAQQSKVRPIRGDCRESGVFVPSISRAVVIRGGGQSGQVGMWTGHLQPTDYLVATEVKLRRCERPSPPMGITHESTLRWRHFNVYSSTPAL
ncbi:hypothetical protein JHW43_006910 [Diplocarpon mali]|nr:hypothetical protein JHW43_006910 [Diplocarpon mali]